MATSVVNPRAQFFANNGRPLIGGRIHTYVAGSSTRARTYKDAAKAQPNTNPIILDGRGEAQIYLADGVEYKFVVEDSKGALIYTQEPVYGAIWPNAEQWPSDATLSYKYMSEAKAAVDSMGVTRAPFDTYAQAANALPDLIEGERIEVSIDETRERARTRYKVEGGSLVFIVNLDQLRQDLSDKDQGSRLIKTPHGDVLSDVVPWVTPFASGAKANGVFNDGPAEAAAHEEANGRAVLYQPESWNGIAATGSIYPTDSKLSSLYGRLLAGLPNSPVSDPAPVVFVGKHSISTREGATNNIWDGGAIYGDLNKLAGTSYGAAITGVARHSGGKGQVIGVHGRGSGLHTEAEVWGGWSYAHVGGTAAESAGGIGVRSAIGHEINVNNRGPNNPWEYVGGVGACRGLVITTVDGSNDAHSGVTVGAHAGIGKWRTAVHLRGFGVRAPSEALTEVGNGEVMRIDGTSSTAAPGGIRFYGVDTSAGKSLRYGISFAEAAYSNNCAMLLGDGQRITVGNGPSSSRYLSFNSTEAWANLQNLTLRINGVQVLGTQRPAIEYPTVTSGDDHATLLSTVQKLQAVINTLRAHGLIGT